MTTPARKAEQKKTGLLLLGHGSRATESVKVLAGVAAALRRRFRNCLVEASFLELNQPDVQAGIDRLMAQGAARILFVPYSPYLDGHVGRLRGSSSEVAGQEDRFDRARRAHGCHHSSGCRLGWMCGATRRHAGIVGSCRRGERWRAAHSRGPLVTSRRC